MGRAPPGGAAFLWTLSRASLALALGGYALRMWAITAGYHRYFAHRSYKTSRAFQLVLAALGATSDRHDWVPLAAYGVACFAIAGLPGLVWGFVVSTLAVFHATMLINSLAHLWGSRRYATTDGSRNNLLLAVLTMGEGWHNNHHHYMSSARQGFFWWEVDVSYYVLRLLALIGVVDHVREPPACAVAPSV